MRHLTRSLIASLPLLSACAGADTLAPPPVPDSPSLAVARAARPFLPGEQQPLVDLTRGTWAIYPVGVGQNLLQTFTPSVDQKLGYLELPVGACEPGVLLNVKIFKGKARRLLYEVNVTGLPAVVDGSFQLIQVYDPAVGPLRLQGGKRYSFELSAFPGPGATGASCGIAKGPIGDSYAGGRGFYSDPVAGWIRLPTGAASDEEDLPFITLVR